MIDKYLNFRQNVFKSIYPFRKIDFMNDSKQICGRFAPSPSGVLHLGNISSCLLAWLDAHSLGGRIIYRLEDLDPSRSKAEYAKAIESDLMLLGLEWDECSQPQSERSAKYADAFEILNRKGLVYPCYCSRNQRLAASAPYVGDPRDVHSCRCRTLSATERRSLEASGKRPAWKVRVPDKEIAFFDGHYGIQRQNPSDDGDFIIRRSDGVYAYQLAVAFDDMDMGINRVVRGRDLLSSTGRQIWLISELGSTAPEYCHAPLISLGDRKMSKRFGDLSMDVLREKLLPEEIIGVTAHLWGLTSTAEAISPTELLKIFSWDKISLNDIDINKK